MSQFNQQDPQWVWSRVVDIVQTWNQDAGTIAPEGLPEDLIDAFKLPAFAQIPKELTTTQPGPTKTDWNKHQHATDLALTNLVGAWNEKSEADIAVLSGLTAEEYSTWVLKAERYNLADSPYSFKNGLWRITDRINLSDR